MNFNLENSIYYSCKINNVNNDLKRFYFLALNDLMKFYFF